MANINDAFPSNYLKASDLAGSQPVVTIDRVAFEPVGQKREMKPILYFVGKDKGVVLNKTNSKNITNLVGSPETDDWVGFKIKLYSANVEFQGEMVESIRVKAAGTNGARAAAPVAVVAEHINDEDIPF
jgi:hypothetical protein